MDSASIKTSSQDRTKAVWKWYQCEQCPQRFQSKHGCISRKPRFCSQECCGKSKQIALVCAFCKKTYNLKKDCAVRGRKYCSMECCAKGRKGIKFTEEHRAALSAVKKGKPVPQWNTPEAREKARIGRKGKPHLSVRGENHPQWKGDMAAHRQRSRDYRRVEYTNWKAAVFKRDDFTCQSCGKRGGKIHADHIKPYALYPELRHDVNNGRTLCVPCHRKTETYGGRITKYKARLAL